MILSEKISGSNISVIIESSNLKAADYNTINKHLMVTFNNGQKYLYYDIPWEIFTKFRMAESQGRYFSSEIKKYKFTKIVEEDTGPTPDSGG